MKPTHDHKCGVCAVPTFERNNYFYGKLITARDSIQEQAFFNEKRRLINRMVLGWGVVCGLNVKWDAEKREFEVSEGLALDCCGREILVCGPARVPFDKYEEHCRCDQERREPPHGRYILCLEYKECRTESVVLPPLSCNDQERQECNRIAEGFQLKIKEWDKDKQPEEMCLPTGCGHLPCLDRFKKPIGEIKDPVGCKTQTIHDYICERSREGCPECSCCDCVVLAVIWVGKRHESTQKPPQKPYQQEPDQQKPEWPSVEIDTCTYRRLVYGNSLLYDLIDCHHGDLPHIVDFNWPKQAYPKHSMDWSTFTSLIKHGLTLTFDQPMVSESLNRHTFFVTFYHEDEGTGALVPKRIPTQSIELVSGPCFTVKWTADKDWVNDELDAKNSLLADGVDIEITVRGSRVWSKNGKALDGEFLADKLPTGNGVQGGDFVDWFTVLARGQSENPAKAYEAF